MWNPTLQTFQTSPEELSREFWKQTPNSFSALSSESMNTSMIPAYKGQVIVSWANIHRLKGDAEISTYWNETGRVLVIIGSFYADILVVLGTNHELLSDHRRLQLPGVWGTARSKNIGLSGFWCAQRVFVLCPFRGVCSTFALGAWEDCNQQSKSGEMMLLSSVKQVFQGLTDDSIL